MPSYIIRKLDDGLWKRVKARAASDELPLRAVLVALVKLYAEGRVSVTTSAKAK